MRGRFASSQTGSSVTFNGVTVNVLYSIVLSTIIINENAKCNVSCRLCFFHKDACVDCGISANP